MLLYCFHQRQEGMAMKILVLNGSPKGQNSVTLQYVKYLAKISKNHEKLCADFDVLDVGKTVYSLISLKSNVAQCLQ